MVLVFSNIFSFKVIRLCLRFFKHIEGRHFCSDRRRMRSRILTFWRPWVIERNLAQHCLSRRKHWWSIVDFFSQSLLTSHPTEGITHAGLSKRVPWKQFSKVKTIYQTRPGKSVQCSSDPEFAFSNVPQKPTSYPGPRAQLSLSRLSKRLRKSNGKFHVLTVHYVCNNKILKMPIRLRTWILSLTIVLTLRFPFY